MRIIISPAKKMNADTDSLPWLDLPCFLPRAEQLCEVLQRMDYAALKKLWGCNDKIAELNVRRFENMDLRRNLAPAILSYEGLQYQHMAPGVFTDQQFDYIQEHLLILSGLYGLLRPFDGVTPYRLEMQAKLSVEGTKDLYGFWGSSIAERLFAETDCILDLASKEYSRCVSKYLRPGIRFVTCVFGEETGGRIVEKGTLCKMARGAMVRYMAENQIREAEQIKGFDRWGYRYDPKRSDEETFVFVKALR